MDVGRAMSERGFRIDSLLLCDDIRKEDNGKAIIIGVYTGDIVVPKFPAALMLSIWLQGHAEEDAESFSLRPELVTESGSDPKTSDTPFSGTGKIKVSAGDEFIIVTEKVVAQVLEPGHISMWMKFGDKEWFELIRKKIVLSPTASIAQRPPS